MSAHWTLVQAGRSAQSGDLLGLILKCSVINEKMKHYKRQLDSVSAECPSADLEILNEIIKHSETLGILRLVDIH
jgi:hypothetical protein